MRLVLKVFLAVVAMWVLLAGTSQAGDTETALLHSYVGSWSGSGVLVGGDAPEAFGCRLKVTKGKQAKLNYAGRCSLVNMNLSVSGTIVYSDKNSRYEATMRSNVGFAAAAAGIKQGKAIRFTLNEKQNDRGGNRMDIGSILELSPNRITVDFSVEFNRSGQVLTTTVPFQRQ
jgi:hypothetical protein